jgi:small GTP-binding protein
LSTAAARGAATPRSELVAALDELLLLATGLLPEGSLGNLAAACSRLSEDRFNLVVLGEFKRGKSTLINALIDRDVVPTSVVPLTSVVTAISGGEADRLIVCFLDGREQERPVTELADFVTEARNPGNRLGVELVRVELDHALLRAGVELVDTPGIGSIHSHNTQAARDFLPRVDAALCVLDAGQPLSEGERELFLETARRVPQLLIVVNKIDHLDRADREVAVGFVRSALRDLLGDEKTELFAVSARTREGIVPLLERLLRLASQEREGLLLRSVGALARNAAADTAQAARFESHAIKLPLDELASRALTFEERIAQLQTAGPEAGDLLDRGIARALEQNVNEPLTEHARREETRLLAALREHVGQHRNVSPRDLSTELEHWIDTTVRAEFELLVPRFETTIADQLTELERCYAARVQRVLEQVQEIAEDVFGARATEVLPEAGLETPSRFSFKLKDPEHALDMIVGFGRTIVPGVLGRRLVVRDAEQRLFAMTDRHAGRLRSELVDRVSDAGRTYRRQLAAAIEEAIDAIRGAIDRASEERRRGEQHAEARLARLEYVEGRCEQLAEDLTRWLDGQPSTPRRATDARSTHER